MMHLPESLQAWDSPDFKGILKREIEAKGVGELPLQQSLAGSSHALEDSFSIMIIRVSEAADAIHAKLGIFYSGIVAGCNCADDPTPVEAQNEYCEIFLTIDKATAEASITSLAD